MLLKADLMVGGHEKIEEMAYLDFIAMTQDSFADPDDLPHAASARADVHDQVLAALGLTRDDPFDAVAWAKATVSAYGDQQGS